MYENGCKLTGYFRKLNHRTQQQKRAARLNHRPTYAILVDEQEKKDEQFKCCWKPWHVPDFGPGFRWYQKYWVQGYKRGKWDRVKHQAKLRQVRHAPVILDDNLPD